MNWVLYFLLLISALAAICLVTITLPGLWLAAGMAAIYAAITHARYLGWHTLIALLALAIFGEVIELASSSAAARAAGGSKKGILGGVVGGILGGIFATFFIPIPIVGTLLGICIGTFIGAAGLEIAGGRNPSHGLRVGLGATKGRLMGIFAKMLVGVVMFIVIAWSAVP